MCLFSISFTLSLCLYRSVFLDLSLKTRRNKCALRSRHNFWGAFVFEFMRLVLGFKWVTMLRVICCPKRIATRSFYNLFHLLFFLSFFPYSSYIFCLKKKEILKTQSNVPLTVNWCIHSLAKCARNSLVSYLSKWLCKLFACKRATYSQWLILIKWTCFSWTNCFSSHNLHRFYFI